jgi:hypothetical protein
VRRHLSAELLALHREGAVSPRKAGRITAHLSACARCADVDAGLAGVSTVLAATSLPPMPEALSQRIQMAIASEAAARATASATPGTAPSGADVRGVGLAAGSAAEPADGAGSGTDEPARVPGRPDLPERRRGGARRFKLPGWSSPALLRGLAAAGALVIIAGGGLLFAHNQSSSGGGAGSGSGSNGGGVPAHKSERRPAASSAGRGVNGSAANGPINVDYRLKGRVATAQAVTTGDKYTRANMAPLVRKAVAGAPPIGKSAAGATPGTTQRPGTTTTFAGLAVRTLTGCLTGLAGGRTILLADVASFLGRPATIVVLKPLTGAHVLDVVVVGVSCSLASPHIIARLTVPAG